MTGARLAASTADVRRAGEALGLAFADDPVMNHLIPATAPDAVRRLTRFLTLAADGAHRLGSLWVHPGGVAAAAWRPPGRWKLRTGELLRGTPTMVGALRGRIGIALSALQAIERHHPTEPHWYLEGLGTEPAHQGRGAGSLVMQPVLDRCDAEGVPAYLESSKERNVPFYERHGFRVTEVITLPKGGPPAWCMWRDPR